MEKLSKTHQLGLIILAFQLMRNLKFPAPRLVTALALCLGVSRKAGYKASGRIETALAAPPPPEDDKERERENSRLRVKLQLVTFERDHPGVRFSGRGKHLPKEAKSLCVRIFRDFRGKLTERELAELTGVALENLRRWDKIADREGKIPQKPERRGIHRRSSTDDEDRVVNFFETLKESLTLEEFTEKFNAESPERALDRKTISRILERRGLKEVKRRSSPDRYHGKVEVYFPGAQAAIDAKKCAVRFAREREETVRVAKESAIDIATGTILGTVVGKEETREGVERVLVKSRAECENILAVLADNRSSNQAVDIRRAIGGEGKVGAIFSFPAHPRTNGHIEGHFGEFSRIVGAITIDDTSRETIAHSVVEVVSNVFDYFKNNTAVRGLGWLTRREYLKRYSPKPEEVEEARRELLRRQARSRALRREPSRLSDPAFRSLVKAAIDGNHFEVDFSRALKSLVPYDSQVIESSSRAFFVASRREGFDEQKRNFAYFMGIVRNKQKAVDSSREKEIYGTQESRRFKEKLEAERRKLAEEKAQERDDLANEPERVILEYSKLLLSGSLRFMRRTCLREIREGLSSLATLGRSHVRVIENLSLTIRGWGEFREELKGEMIDLLFGEYRGMQAANPG
jgi:hypothetical protein